MTETKVDDYRYAVKKIGATLPVAQWQLDEAREWQEAEARWAAMTPEERAERDRARREARAAELAAAKAIHGQVLAAVRADTGPAMLTLAAIAIRHTPVRGLYGVSCEHCHDGQGDHAAWPCADAADVAAAVGIEVPE